MVRARLGRRCGGGAGRPRRAARAPPEIERLGAEGTIGGGEPNVAHFQLAASLRALEAVGDLAPLTRHPAFGWAATGLPPLPGPLPPGLPAEWLEPVRRTA